MINYIENGDFSFTPDSGIRFQSWFTDVIREIRESIPEANYYLFDYAEKSQKKNGLTKHCILQDPIFYEYETEGISCAKWIENAMNGKRENYGLKLLEERDEQNNE